MAISHWRRSRLAYMYFALLFFYWPLFSSHFSSQIENSWILFKIRTKIAQIRLIASLVTAKFSNSHNTSYSCELLHGNSGQMGTPILTLGNRVKLQAISRVRDRLFTIILNCWQVNDLTTCWQHRICNPSKLRAVLAIKSLLELGGDECDNLNFMNFKDDSFKICQYSWILGTFKIREIRVRNLCASDISQGPRTRTSGENLEKNSHRAKQRSFQTDGGAGMLSFFTLLLLLLCVIIRTLGIINPEG